MRIIISSLLSMFFVVLLFSSIVFAESIIVKKNDNFWKLSKQYNVSWYALMHVNKDKLVHPGNFDLIYPGQVFDLPIKIENVEPVSKKEHVDKKGDSKVKDQYPGSKFETLTIVDLPKKTKLKKTMKIESVEIKESYSRPEATQKKEIVKQSIIKSQLPNSINGQVDKQSERLMRGNNINLVQVSDQNQITQESEVVDKCEDLPSVITIAEQPFIITIRKENFTCKELRMLKSLLSKKKKTENYQ